MSKKIKQSEVMEIVKEVFQNGFVVDRNNQEDHTDYIGILSVPYKNKLYAVPIYKEGCILSPLYFSIDDGRVHLSNTIIGGDILPSNHGGDLIKTVEQYNSERLFSCGNKRYTSFESLLLITRNDWEYQQKKTSNK